MNEIDKIIEEVTAEHPYKERGNRDSYSQYNEGWSDACDILGERIKQELSLYNVINWVTFDWMKIETRPTKYGKYLITRKDGKIHWETWNGNGWAYNHNEIRYWAEIKPPCL